MTDSTYQSPWTHKGLKLFYLGFITLFLELILIRYLAGNIWNLGYFPNLVLVSVFIGMGLGFTFHHFISEKLSSWIFQLSIFILLALIAFVYFEHPTVPGFSSWQADLSGDLYFTSVPQKATEQHYSGFLVCLVLLVCIFAFITQRTAKYFRCFKPLTAYTLDIAGSCAGIILFMLLSWFQIPAFKWFSVFFVFFVLAMSDNWKSRWIPVIPAICIFFFASDQDKKLLSDEAFQGVIKVVWSPYQKLEVKPVQSGGTIFANGVGHQEMLPKATLQSSFHDSIYKNRYNQKNIPAYKDILILGSGSGNDVATALLNNVNYIDAVEIDPGIAQFGKTYHALKPYSDARVKLTIDDGRSFMTQSQKKYDLVVFALTDSLIKASSISQLRLENYLFTLESTKRAFELLNDQGDLIFYNYYRSPWLLKKIENMILQATNKTPVIIWQKDDFAVIRVRKEALPPDEQINKPDPDIQVPTDDWPFLYLQKRGIPMLYAWVMGGLFIFIFSLLCLLHWINKNKKTSQNNGNILIKTAFVFMGIAFLLLQTKGIIQFSLLFGTTWLNNSLVFLAVLFLVLLANWTSMLFKEKTHLKLIFVLLIGSSLISLVFPLQNLLQINSTFFRFISASLITFSPIFFANLIFSLVFRDQKIAEHIFGWNLIGATLGGIIEYSSMLLGYNLLSVIVAICYIIVFILILKSNKETNIRKNVNTDF